MERKAHSGCHGDREAAYNGDCGLSEWLTQLIRDRVVQKPWPVPKLEWVAPEALDGTFVPFT